MSAIQAETVATAINPAVTKVLQQRRRDSLQRTLLGIGFPVFLLAVWEILTHVGYIDIRFFPSPSRIVYSAYEVATTPSEASLLLGDIVTTLKRLAIGYALGAVSGVVVGAAMGLYRPVRYALGPLVYATFPTPKLAIFPLLIVIFGLGDSSKIALITLAVFYMTAINTLSGVIHANPVYQDFAKAFRIPLFTQWFRVALPSALPSIMAGLKLGIGQALIMVVSAEFISSNDGIGYYIWTSWQVLDIARMFVGLAVVMIIGGIAVWLSNWVERILLPWAKR